MTSVRLIPRILVASGHLEPIFRYKQGRKMAEIWPNSSYYFRTYDVVNFREMFLIDSNGPNYRLLCPWHHLFSKLCPGVLWVGFWGLFIVGFYKKITAVS